MIAKLAWWVLLGHDSFCVKVLRAEYKVDSNWLQTRPARYASFAWRGLEGVRDILAKGACLLMGLGHNILVWRDPWIPDLHAFIPQPRDNFHIPQSMAVGDLMTQDKLGWDLGKLNSLFNDEIVQAIKNIPRWSNGQEDKWIWLKTTSGDLIVKSAYKEITYQEHNHNHSTIFGKIWKLHIHERLKMHLWRIASNLLPTKAALSRFANNMDVSCSLCDYICESDIHLFWTCPLARALWFESEWCIRTDVILVPDTFKLIEMLIKPPVELCILNKDKFILMGELILDQVWKL
uniref:Reverse transcriptase zinc-binding domain-containing protein n=1 Tax=Fagus sylvatica TaxID=28930 RepID=A0A2N9IKL2_FAGSY